MTEINAPCEHAQASDTQIVQAYNGNNVTIRLVLIIFGVVVVCITAYGWITAELAGKADKTDLVKAMEKQDTINHEIKSELTAIKIDMAKIKMKLGIEDSK